MKLWCLIPILVLVLILAPAQDASVAQNDSGGDKLIYFVNNFDGEAAFTIYDPESGENRPIYPTSGSILLSFSVDGRLAFSDDGQIYILDTQVVDSEPVPITTDPTMRSSPLAWSPDGHYLAIASTENAGNTYQLYIWDGETAINITPNGLHLSSLYGRSWSSDNRLAFTAASDDTPSGIYIWDGETTFYLCACYAPSWSPDGRLAFMSERGVNARIFIWDGVSFKNDVPDADTFAQVPLVPTIYSDASWTNIGLLTFEAIDPEEGHSQIYMWDGQTATNISQNPGLHNGGALWSADGRWAFVTFFSPEQLLYVRDADNRMLLTTEGQYLPAWSVNGYLAFCTWNHYPEWTLAVWDGQQIVELATGQAISAQWQGGSDTIHCSSG